jgi:hypothetical protein
MPPLLLLNLLGISPVNGFRARAILNVETRMAGSAELAEGFAALFGH